MISRRTNQFGLTILLAIVLLVVVTTAPARAAIIQNIKLPIDEEILHPHTGEAIHLTGYTHIQISMTYNRHGGLNMHINVNMRKAHGVSSSGDKYVVTGGYKYTYHYGMASALVGGQQDKIRITGPGRGNNFALYIKWHYVYTAKGKLAVYIHDIGTWRGTGSGKSAPSRHRKTAVLWGQLKTR